MPHHATTMQTTTSLLTTTMKANMKPFSKSLQSIAPIFATLALAACGGSSSTHTPSGPIPVSITFDLIANGSAAKCGTPITGLGTKASSADLRDARFYVSNVNLIDAAGKAVPVTLTPNDWQNDKVSLISLVDGTGVVCGGLPMLTNTAIVGTVPSGNYKGIQYEIGVPEALNHSDYATAAKPLGVAAMAWSWTSGRKFLKVELNTVGGVNVIRTNASTNVTTTTVASTWNLHLGSGGCTTNATTGAYSCTNPNRMPVKLAAFDASTQKISLDLTALFSGTDLSTDNAGATGCMSGTTDTECPVVFGAMKIDLATGAPSTGSTQSVFIARSK